MERDTVRLEVLKLVINRTLSPEDNVKVAKIYEGYIVGTSAEPVVVKRGRGRPPKAHVDNSLLSEPTDNRKDGGLTQA